MRALFLPLLLLATVASTLGSAPVPDFKLLDTNTHSPRRNKAVSPRDYLLQVSAFYFADAHCSYCRLQFGYLNKLRLELQTNVTDLNIEILGVNLSGEPDANTLMTAGRVLPWLQDTSEAKVGEQWQVTYRDVRILDPQNQTLSVFNLTQNDLSKPENFDALKKLFLEAAKSVDSDRDGLPDDWELRYFTNLSAKPGDDSDNDGQDNFTEFAFGTDPASPQSATPLRQRLTVGALTGPIWIGFNRRAGSILRYALETSSNLKEWVPAAPERLAIQDPENLFDGTGTAQVNCFYGDGVLRVPAGFLRVRAYPAGATP